MMKKPSTRVIALQLERKEAEAWGAFARASEQSEAKIIAAVESIRPFREKLQRARLERATFVKEQTIFAAPGPAVPDPEPEQLRANLSLSALARALHAQTSAAPEKHLIDTESCQMST